jgi:hypothetical protein
MVKLTPEDFDDKTEKGTTVGEVLQVFESSVPSAPFGVMKISLADVTAVVSTTQVPADAATSQ